MGKEKIQYSPLAKYLYDIRIKRGYARITQAVGAMFPELEREREALPQDEKQRSPFDYRVSLLSRYECATIPNNPIEDELFNRLVDAYKIPMEKIVAVCDESKRTRRYWAPKRKKSGATSTKRKNSKSSTSSRPLLDLIKKINLGNQAPSNIEKKMANHADEIIKVLREVTG